MSILEYGKIKWQQVICLSCLVFVLTACKDHEPEYVYTINKQTITDVSADKPNVKSSTEYISIAHSDVLGSAISNRLLSDLKNIYIAIGDKGVAENLIVKNFLAKPQAQIPNQVEMRADVEAFINNAYRQTLNRNPNDYEVWYLKTLIEENDTLQPKVIYYALMTSNEYRQF